MTQGMTQQGDMVDVLVKDHRAVESAFQEYERGGLSEQARRGLVDHIITELVRHSVAEEQYLYPTARKSLPDGDSVADHEIQEHAEAEEVMKQLEGMEPSEAEYDRLVRKLIEDIRHHVDDEERDLFPRLQRSCSAEEMMELGSKITKAKERAPTRPHPSAPDKPPANMILDPGAGMVDRLRDSLSGRDR
ncbi:Hemerythrin HHE cation binding domain-containing protein [Saccharopolyspora kobensis]|uniref:Hemerythrin HHE cation binding domain-containing protein n=1 Tax=Saccharopolyspora kobensis TaxID=146035 RepID=A0A1H6AGT0_9PSEU|nr:hemerythrin domain-containing protein [Saccharopolyspora kobensis]SEG47267.1 Hemerythrin HHE cation binding domain-containing protein [Saccharopolyspora kobensis]SFE56050.1 Hemerythrin HHE cation binding domain-containing protein [Saccharopolyspora kobensis]